MNLNILYRVYIYIYIQRFGAIQSHKQKRKKKTKGSKWFHQESVFFLRSYVWLFSWSQVCKIKLKICIFYLILYYISIHIYKWTYYIRFYCYNTLGHCIVTDKFEWLFMILNTTLIFWKQYKFQNLQKLKIKRRAFW